jgi:hypothetical protein
MFVNRLLLRLCICDLVQNIQYIYIYIRLISFGYKITKTINYTVHTNLKMK